MSSVIHNRQDTLASDQTMVTGIQKRLAGKSFTVNDKSYSTQDVVAVFQGRVTTGQAVVSSRAAWLAAVKADRDERSQTAAFASAFQNIVKGMFQDPSALADFGLTPRKSGKKTVEVKSTAVAKNLATRQARGTMGKKQKAKIKGSVTQAPSQGGAGAIVTPSAASSAGPAASTATAPAPLTAAAAPSPKPAI
jgi:hypothetical protein